MMSGEGDEELPNVFLYCPVHLCVCGIFLSRVIIPHSSKRSTYCRQSKDKTSIHVGSQGLGTLDINYLLPKRARSTRTHNVLKKEEGGYTCVGSGPGSKPFYFSLRSLSLDIFTPYLLF